MQAQLTAMGIELDTRLKTWKKLDATSYREGSGGRGSRFGSRGGGGGRGGRSGNRGNF